MIYADNRKIVRTRDRNIVNAWDMQEVRIFTVKENKEHNT